MGDRLLFGHNAFQQAQAPLVGLVEIDRGPEIHPREQPVGIAAERVLSPRVRGDLVTQYGCEPAVRVGCRRCPFLKLGMQRVVARRGVGDHVDEQLLDLARLLDPARHLPDRGRMARGHGGSQRVGVAGHAVGDPGQPLADQRPIIVGVGGHQVEYVAHRLQWRGDHVELADIESRVVQLDLHTEPFPHRGECHDVDVVLGCGASSSRRRSGRRRHGRPRRRGSSR